jgi:hypothetical protein
MLRFKKTWEKMAVHTVTLAHVIHGGRHNIKQGNADGFENASAARPLLLDSIVFAQQQWENDHSRAQVVKKHVRLGDRIGQAGICAKGHEERLTASGKNIPAGTDQAGWWRGIVIALWFVARSSPHGGSLRVLKLWPTLEKSSSFVFLLPAHEHVVDGRWLCASWVLRIYQNRSFKSFKKLH